jgi:hypothetical protein
MNRSSSNRDQLADKIPKTGNSTRQEHSKKKDNRLSENEKQMAYEEE